jgi:hypothetical protein
MKEALSSSSTSVPTRATWRNIPQGAILHSHRCENLKSYINYYVHRISLLVCTLSQMDSAHIPTPLSFSIVEIFTVSIV